MYSKLFSLISLWLIFTVVKTSANCSKVGTFCNNDCTKIVFCSSLGANEVEVATCGPDNGGYCKENENGATCSTATRECSSPGSENIICGGVASFPHPTACGRSVVCNGFGVEPIKDCYCKEDLVVDATVVSLPCVPGPPPPTECPLDVTGPATRGPYCYLPSEKGIIAYLCPTTLKMDIYNGSFPNLLADGDKNCVDRTTSPSTSGSEPTTESTEPTTATEPTTTTEPTTATEPTSTTTTTPAPLPTCTKPGQTFPDPYDCHSYYLCNSQLQPEHKKCSAKRYFYKPVGVCVDGTCSNNY